MKNIFTTITMVLIIFSCSDNSDDNQSNNNALLIGDWKLMETIWTNSSGEISTFDFSEGCTLWTFDNQNIFRSYSGTNSDCSNLAIEETVDYRTNGNNSYERMSENGWIEYEIIELTPETMRIYLPVSAVDISSIQANFIKIN